MRKKNGEGKGKGRARGGTASMSDSEESRNGAEGASREMMDAEGEGADVEEVGC
jgi:hypothetical protein